jgi:hypothetical protein
MSSADPVVTIELPSGLVLRDAVALLRQKFQQWPWDRFDGVPLADPNIISDDDVDVSFRGARARSNVNRIAYKAAFRERQQEITGLLRAIPADVALEDADLDQLRTPVVRLYGCLMAMRSVKLANATKATYRHRPRLLPVIDSALNDYYWYATSIRDEARWLPLHRMGWGEYAFAVLSLFRDDLCAVVTPIDQVRRAIGGTPFAGISRVRLLEALIWYYYLGR